MTYTEPQAQVVWTGHYTRVKNGALFTTTSSFDTVLPRTVRDAWDVLVKREGWLPWQELSDDPIDRAYGRPKRGGWTLQEVEARPKLVKVCPRCGDTGCGGPSNPHD